MNHILLIRIGTHSTNNVLIATWTRWKLCVAVIRLLSIRLLQNCAHKHSCHKRHMVATVHPKKYAHGFCFAVLCCDYTLTDFPISIRLTSLALWQSNDCPSASKATLMNMDKYFMWIHYERLHNHNKATHNKTMCIFLGIYCITFIWFNKRNKELSIEFRWLYKTINSEMVPALLVVSISLSRSINC